MCKKIKEMKSMISTNELCAECPRTFRKYFDYVKSLKFEQTPDYEFLKKLFKKLAKKHNIDIKEGKFDWSDADFNAICDYDNRFMMNYNAS